MDAVLRGCVVITTCGNMAEAETLAEKLVMAKLAACVQLEEIKSFYAWENDCATDNEVRLTIKTPASKFKELESFILGNHTYQVPEIIMTEIRDGYEPYLSWMEEACTK